MRVRLSNSRLPAERLAGQGLAHVDREADTGA